jgi:hypothetical protein
VLAQAVLQHVADEFSLVVELQPGIEGLETVREQRGYGEPGEGFRVMLE